MSLIIIIKLLISIFGLLIGSFLNVVIYRMPRNLSIVTPRSSCSNCNKLILWYENIPVISYLILRGRCSSCQKSYGPRYLIVEFITGVMAFALFPSDLNIDSILIFSFKFSVACVLLVHLLIDIEHHLLLDKINIFFLALVIPYAIYFFKPYYWIAGGLIGFLGPLCVTWLFYKFRGVVGLGGGDIKIFGILGLLLGPLGILSNIFMSCLLGSVLGLALIAMNKLNKDTPFAFGPYIIVTAATQLYFPEFFTMINFLQF